MQILLVANRGEIALRIMRSAKQDGYRTLAIYSDADRNAAHVLAADLAIGIGGKSSAESYLDINKVIAAAKTGGATAVHPGYGFLAENPDFARACAAENIQFIGPDADTIDLMGNKRAAKQFAERHGIPCIPGFQGAQDDETLIRESNRIGFPLMLKAAAGGGGRGMRLVHQASELKTQFKSARAEALAAFGNDELIVEKALINARHIEIQIVADNSGNTIYLGERDCSIQRRHQKIVEETPSPAVDEKLRKKMGIAAVTLSKACNYIGAGTVEFLLDTEKNFYFLEMNTRLQVEHGITEQVNDVDLVAWQLAISRGEPLPKTQDEVRPSGHSIEVRLYAEDPQQNFMPQTGKILYWREPDTTSVRIDHALTHGGEISPYYDPMIGKLLSWGKDREQARRKLADALRSLDYIGPINNRFFLQQILQSEAFIQGNAHTGFLQYQFTPVDNNASTSDGGAPGNISPATLALACALFQESSIQPLARSSNRANWSTCAAPLSIEYVIESDDFRHSCQLIATNNQSNQDLYLVTTQDRQFSIEILDWTDARVNWRINGIEQNTLAIIERSNLHLLHHNQQWEISNQTHAPAHTASQTGDGRILAPMEGNLTEICVMQGDQVTNGQTLAVMEAMKMEHPLKANCAGIISAIEVTAGNQLRSGQLLIQISVAS